MGRCAGALLLISGAAALALACGGGADTGPSEAESELLQRKIRRVEAVIRPANETDVWGSAIFIQEGSEVTLQLSVEGAEPGEHACRIHEVGDCSAADASSAGDPWSPEDVEHDWSDSAKQLGDIGNVRVGDDGTGTLMLTTDRWTIGGGGPNDVLGKSVVVHAGPADFSGDDSGDPGDRVACGVIRL